MNALKHVSSLPHYHKLISTFPQWKTFSFPLTPLWHTCIISIPSPSLSGKHIHWYLPLPGCPECRIWSEYYQLYLFHCPLLCALHIPLLYTLVATGKEGRSDVCVCVCVWAWGYYAQNFANYSIPQFLWNCPIIHNNLPIIPKNSHCIDCKSHIHEHTRTHRSSIYMQEYMHKNTQ